MYFAPTPRLRRVPPHEWGGKGGVHLFQERLDHRLLECRRKIGARVRTHGLAQIAKPIEKGGLEPAEAVLEARQGWPRQGLALGVAGPREPVERRSARVPQSQHPRRLVERLARGIVARTADDLEPAVLGH